MPSSLDTSVPGGLCESWGEGESLKNHSFNKQRKKNQNPSREGERDIPTAAEGHVPAAPCLHLTPSTRRLCLGS